MWGEDAFVSYKNESCTNLNVVENLWYFYGVFFGFLFLYCCKGMLYGNFGWIMVALQFSVIFLKNKIRGDVSFLFTNLFTKLGKKITKT